LIDKKEKLTLWGKIKNILLFVPSIALVLGIFYHISAINRYKEQLPPEIDCNYKYFYNIPKPEYKYIIKNTGSIDCTNIWAEEEIYLVIDGEVYESNDTPHFNYFIYNGSRDSIWNLKKGEEVEVKINPLQITAFDLLKEKFKPIIITKWKFIYSKENSSKKYFYEKYFIFDFHDRTFKEVDSYVGGISYIEKIKGYLSSGTNRYIDIFVLTGDFEINPPRAFLVLKDFSILPLNLWTKLRIEDFNNSLLFYPGSWDIQPSDDITCDFLFYDWDYENGKFVKAFTFRGATGENFVYTKPLPMEPSYLSKDDKEKVIKNPKILKTFCYLGLNISVESDNTEKKKERSNQQKPQDKQNKAKERYKYIMDKAEEKYLSEKNN
jgi:hypothetical protein